MKELAALPKAGAKSVVFFGTPEIAVTHLQALVASGCNVRLVVTRPDVRRSRGNSATASPVKIAAQKLGIEVTHKVEDVIALVNEANEADTTDSLLGVVVAFGEIISMDVLARVPMINVHFSLLPRWRGAAPVERAILAGDATTGVCIMRVGEKLDEGEVFSKTEITIDDLDTTDSLKFKLNQLSLKMVLDAVRFGAGSSLVQSGEPVYAKKIKSEDMQINWNASATQVLRQIRVGGAFTFVNGKRLKVLQAKIVQSQNASRSPGGISLLSKTECVVATGDVGLMLLEVQPEGKSAMSIEGWLNGARLSDDLIFGS